MNWTKKEVTRDGTTQIELRATLRGAQVLIIVALDGYNHKWYNTKHRSTKGLNLHFAANGGLQLTFDEWNGLMNQVALAEQELRMMEAARGN